MAGGGMSPYAFACVQLVCSGISNTLQFLTLPIFLLYPDYRSRVSHHMMFAIGVFDCSQTVTHFVGDLYYIFGVDMTGPVERLMAAINLVGWNGLVLQHFLLALNRFCAIVPPFFRPDLRDSRPVENLFKALQAALWLWYLATVLLFLTPLMGGSFEPAFVGYSVNDTAYPDSPWFDNFYAYMGTTIPWVAIACYLSIFVILKMSRNRQQNNSSNSRELQMSKAEKNLLIQAVILFSGLLVFDYYWPSFQLGQQMWIFANLLYCGLNPVLYLTMSTEFRQRFAQTYRLKSAQNSNSRVVPVKHVTNATLPFTLASRVG